MMRPATNLAATPRQPRVLQTLAPIIIIVAGLAAYANQFAVPFLFDDIPSIVWNARLRTLETALSLFTDPGRHDITIAGRPVAAMTLAVNYAISGLGVWSYHAVNVAIHIAAGLTLFGIIRRTLLLPRFEPRFARSAATLALIITLLWLLHPMQTKAVTYIVQRVESLAGLMILLMLYAVIRGSQSTAGRGWFIFAAICGVLGAGVKEIVVVAPVLILLYDRTFLARTFAGAIKARWPLYAGLGLTWVATAFGLIGSPRLAMAGKAAADVTPPLDYAMTQCWAIIHYLRLALWPTALTFDYGLADGGVDIIRQFSQALPWAMMIAALLLATVVALARRSWVGFAGAWFFIILAPTSSVVPVPLDIVAEHRMYLPLAAIVTLVVMGGYLVGCRIMADAATARLGARIGVAIATAVVLLLGWLTWDRNRDYRSDLAIWSDTVDKRPGNARALTNLGLALEMRGDLPQAVARQRLAVQARPDYAEARHNLGTALLRSGQIDEAADSFRRAIDLTPDSYESHFDLAQVLLGQQRNDDAVVHFKEALRLRPELVEARVKLGSISMIQGNMDDALRQLQEAVRQQPDHAEAHHLLGIVLATQGHAEAALVQLEKAVQLNPDLPNARAHLDQLRSMMRKP